MSRVNPTKLSLNSREDGFAALIIGIILVLVLSLLTVGFAQLVSREQRKTLDKQLSTQAFYAAESGVNDAIQYIKQNPTVGSNARCDDFLPNFATSSAIGPDVSYTCLLVDMTPPNITWTGGSSGVDQFNPVNDAGTPVQAQSLTLSWEDADAPGSFWGTPDPFPQFLPEGLDAGQWGSNASVVEFTVTPLDGYDRTSLDAHTFTVYLYPDKTASGSIDYATNSANQGKILHGGCSSSNDSSNRYACEATINFPAPLPAGTKYLVDWRNLYSDRSSNVIVDGQAVSGGSLNFPGGTATIDSTGKAQDVLKRILVSVPLTSNGVGPAGALVAGDSLCKDLLISPIASQTQVGVNNSDCQLASSASPGGTPANYSAGIGGGCTPTPANNNCNYDPATETYHWDYNFSNTSPAGQDSITTGCTWVFSVGHAPIQNQSCDYGDALPVISFLDLKPANFPTSGPPAGCYTIPITVTLTQQFNNGKNAKFIKTVQMPQCF